MFYTRWRPSCLTPTGKCRIAKSLIRGIIDVQNMKLCYVRFGKVGGCISFITLDDHVNDDHDDHDDHDHDDHDGDDDDHDDDDDGGGGGGGHDDWPPSHVGNRWKGFHRIGFTWVRWIYIAVHDVHVMFVVSWLTGRRIGKTSASIGASLLFPFLSARECKIWAGFWAEQVCWQSQHEKTCIQSVPESSKTHYSDSPNVKRTCVSRKQISDTLQLSICCCRHHNADVSHAMHWHPEHDFNMKYWNNHCHVMSCHVMYDGKSRHTMVWTEDRWPKWNWTAMSWSGCSFSAFRSLLPRDAGCWLQSAWVLVWSHPIIQSMRISVTMIIRLSRRCWSHLQQGRSQATSGHWKTENWSMLKPFTETQKHENSFHRQGCLVAEGGWHLRRLPDGHPTKLGECSARPGYLQMPLRHSAKHRLGIASEVHVSNLQSV